METPQKKSIKNWSEDDRPREKLSLHGAKALSNSELLALIFATGSQNFSALDLAKNILDKADNSLEKLSKFSLHDMQKERGIGPAKAVCLTAVFEIARRRASELPKKLEKISSSKDAYHIILPKVEGLPHEEFGVILLNRSNTVLSVQMVSRGGVSATVVDAKIIFNLALSHLASNIILFHNHPSGQLLPSKEDNTITEKIKQGAKFLDIAVLDHIIATDTAYYSYADEGRL